MPVINPDFIQFIQDDLPPQSSLEEFIAFCEKPLRRSIRINTLKISVKAFIQYMGSKGWQFEPIPWCDNGFWITGHNEDRLGNCIEHLQGLFYIQEASSMLPPSALFNGNHKKNVLLDMASAPGSKTTQIAALMNNNGLLIANEYSSSRVKVLHANIARMGVGNSALTHFDGNVFGEYLYETFDAILLDAPCSGEGTIRKDPNALKNWQQTDIEQIAAVQQQLILSAFMALKPGGTLVYSTCTLNRQENQHVCHYLKNLHPHAVEFNSLSALFSKAELATTEEGFLHIWPQYYDSEGFFVASITKTTSIARQIAEPKKQKNFPFSHASRQQQEKIFHYFNQQFNIQLPSSKQLMVRDNEYWLFPTEFDTLIGKMRFQRIGLKLADETKNGFKVKHEAIIALANKQSLMIEINSDQAQSYLMGRDIEWHTTNKGEVILSYLHSPLGLAKALPNRLKNGLPRELVRDEACQS